MNDDCILSVSHLSKSVSSGDEQLTILHDISLRVTRGESLAIVGASGSGKTTLLSLLAGLDTPSSGCVNFLGHDLALLDEDARAKLRASKVGFIFQSFQLMPTLTAVENVMLPLELQGHKHALEEAKRWLAKVNLGHRLFHYPSQLSGGEQQRTAIARAFAVKPELLFADEPTGNLDKKSALTVSKLLFDLNHGLRTTLIIVTHDERLAKRCHRQLTIDDGVFV